MLRTFLEQIMVERKLSDAWFRANDLVPFSPAWDAAMSEVEDLERELWRVQSSLARPEVTPQADAQPLAAS